jgi:hypothetical protein
LVMGLAFGSGFGSGDDLSGLREGGVGGRGENGGGDHEAEKLGHWLAPLVEAARFDREKVVAG